MPTDPEYWDRLKAAFASLSELAGPARQERLERLASHDPRMHAEVVDLLDASENVGERFEQGAALAAGLSDETRGLVGQTVAQWKIVREIGQGGMGAVYEAHRIDEQYDKRVAFKTIATGRASEAMLRRFRHERQILARLEHPNIATLLDGGVAPDGQPYFVMEYVEGEPIDRWCAAHKADLPTRLGLFRQVCAAVQYAHEQLVVHRDLKPRNILVTTDGTVKLLDFGIAKLLEPTLADPQLTMTGALPMTVAYASPEQRRGAPVATASDIYSLGVVLYELLAGRRPFEDPLPGSEPADSTLVAPSRLVTETGAAAAGLPDIRKLRRALGGDLDSIVLKALRPEPNRRYRSAQLLADDLGNYLDGSPVTAQSDALSYRAGKFVGRHKAAVLSAGLAVLALIGGATASLQQARVARAERDHALREAKRTAQVTAFLQEVFASARPQRQGRSVTVVQAIDSAIGRIDSSFAGDPDLRASIKLTLGSTLNDMFLYERARPLLEDAWRLRRSLDGDRPSKEQADALYDLANIESQIGSAGQAESLYRVSLTMLGRLPSPDSADIWEGMSNVAEAQLNQGKVAEAAALYDSVARALDRLRPSDLETRGITRANRGTALAQLGRTVEAESALREAVGLFEQARGPEDARVASALQPLAGTLIFNRKFAEAESVARKAVRIDEREFGPTNPATLSALRMVTGAMVESGRCDAAMPDLQRMLVLRGKELPETDPTLGTVLLQMGQCQLAASRLPAAESTLRDALAVRRKSLGQEHWAVGQVQSVLGEVLVKLGRAVEGRMLLREGYDRLVGSLGPDHLRSREAGDRLIRYK